MARVVLDSAKTTNLRRTTVHDAYRREVFGLFVLDKLVPIVFNVRVPGERHNPVIISWQKPGRKTLAYSDLGLLDKCCQKIFAFNLRHYVKCYLPQTEGTDGGQTEPYTYNLCQHCGVSIKDDKGHSISYIAKRSYRRDRYIYKSDNRLAASARDDVFRYQERAI